MRIHEQSPVSYDEARMERLMALYERYCSQAGAGQDSLGDRRPDVTVVPCKLAPAVLRRATIHSPQ